MKCQKCKKSFDLALELSNGRVCCPYCLSELGPSDLFVTLENKESFDLSETYFKTYLDLISQEIRNGNKGGNKNNKNKKTTDSKFYLNNALKFCKKSADAGNPEAILKLGYYYAKGYPDGFPEYKIAWNYIARIIRNKEAVEKAYKKNKEDVESVGRKAAFYLNDLLLSATDEFYDSVKCEIEEKGEIKNRLKDYGVQFKCERTIKEIDVVDYFINFIENRKTTGHTPLFGLFKVKGRDVKRVRDFFDPNAEEYDVGFCSDETYEKVIVPEEKDFDKDFWCYSCHFHGNDSFKRVNNVIKRMRKCCECEEKSVGKFIEFLIQSYKAGRMSQQGYQVFLIDDAIYVLNGVKGKEPRDEKHIENDIANGFIKIVTTDKNLKEVQ